jgi:hypothetical protein
MIPPTAFQNEIATALGISLSGADALIAAARIRDHVALAIAPDEHPRAPSEKQVRFAKDLGVFTEGDTWHVLIAKIQAELTRRNAIALQRLRLKPGDTVEYTRSFEYDGKKHTRATRHVVSSIGKDLRVYFKNPGSESGGWPSQLKRVRGAR